MRLTIPLTGTVLVEGEVFGKGDLVGDDNDPIRPIEIGLGDVSYVMVDLDMVNEVMVIEVEAADKVQKPDLDSGGQQKRDADGNLMFKRRSTTTAEKTALLQQAKGLVEGRTKDELYQISGSPRLKRPG